MIFYHGSISPRVSWDFESLGHGNDQFGPGWYFTDNKRTAVNYASGPNGVLHRCDINMSNVCPNVGDMHKFKRQIVQSLKLAPNFENNILDWDDNINVAMNNAVNSIMQYTNGPHDMIQQIWIDFYRGHEDVWAKNIKKIFSWSLALPDSTDNGGDQFAVVWDPVAITILSMDKVASIEV